MLQGVTFSWLLMIALVISAIAGYLLGSINFAIITTKIKANEDIRDFGSGNAGMTNVLRTLGKGPAVWVLVGDFLKGLAATLLGYLFVFLIAPSNNIMIGGYIACIFALLGHLFPLYHGFRGGKGILVSAGAIAALNPIAFVVILLTFLIVVAFSKIVSLASISAAVMFPIATVVIALIMGSQSIWFQLVFSLVIAILVIIMHRQNIGRLYRGEENRFGKKKG